MGACPNITCDRNNNGGVSLRLVGPVPPKYKSGKRGRVGADDCVVRNRDSRPRVEALLGKWGAGSAVPTPAATEIYGIFHYLHKSQSHGYHLPGKWRPLVLHSPRFPSYTEVP